MTFSAIIGERYKIVWRGFLASSLLALAVCLPLSLPANTVISWGNSDYMLPTGMTNIVAADAAGMNSMGLVRDRTVVVFGDAFGMQATNVPGLSNVVALAGGTHNWQALRTDGSLAVVPGFFDGFPGASNVVGVATSDTECLILRRDGTLAAKVFGAIGPTRPVPAGLSNVIAVASHGFVLGSDGRVRIWPGDVDEPVATVGLSNIVAIAAGDYGMALRADGVVFEWNGVDLPGATLVAGLSNVVAVASGLDNIRMALDSGGRVFAWDGSGQIPVPPDVTNAVAVIAGYGCSALIGEGPPFFANPELPDQVVAAGVGTVVLNLPATGSFPLQYQWQINGANIPNATNSWLVLSNLTPAASGIYSLVASNSIGTATTPGVEVTVEPAFFVQHPADTEIFVGGAGVLNVEVVSELPCSYQWRFNGIPVEGQTNPSLVLTNIQFSQDGYYSVVVSNHYGVIESANARLAVTQLATWGDMSFLPRMSLAGLTNIAAVSAGWRHLLILMKDGSVVGLGDNSRGQINIPAGLSNVVAISGSDHHSLALLASGAIVAIGNPWEAETMIPPGLTNVVAIAAGYSRNLSLRADGTVAEWGSGSVEGGGGLTNIVAVARRDFANLALTANGSVIQWEGFGYYPPLAGVSNITGIAAGVWQQMALHGDGTVIVWGDLSYGQTNYPPGLSNIVTLASGNVHCLALREDGRVLAWGSNLYGNTNPPSNLRDVVAISCTEHGGVALIDEPRFRRSWRLSAIDSGSGVLEIRVPTDRGSSYVLERADTTSLGQWSVARRFTGDGTFRGFVFTNSPGQSGFFRARRF